MNKAMALALSLSRAQDGEALIGWLLTQLLAQAAPSLALVGVVSPCGQHLHCHTRQGARSDALTLSATDFTHPFTYVLHRCQPRRWDSLHGGARIPHPDMQALIRELAPHTGMLALPLCAQGARAMGVMVLFGAPAQLAHADEPELAALAEVFACQWEHVTPAAAPPAVQVTPAWGLTVPALAPPEDARWQLIGESAAMRVVRDEVNRAGRHRLSVLILGETGTGKEVVARMIHAGSARARAPFVAINCSAIPENLIESELFGYEKGAFSGATAAKVGLMVQAHGGTLFLDEVGDMPAPMQAKLLRVLETREVRPLGAQREVPCAFRLIAATHQPLTSDISAGRFRQDLFHRVAQCVLRLKPLRERPQDIAALCDHFFAQCVREQAFSVGPLAPDLVAQLTRYRLEGNVRELKNLIEVACAHTLPGQPVSLSSLPAEQRARVCGLDAAQAEAYGAISDLRLAIRQFEAAIISARLTQFKGNQAQVADSLNLPRRTLHYKCKQLSLTVAPPSA